MIEKTIAEHRLEILAAIERDEPAYSPETTGERSAWTSAASQLEDNAFVRVVPIHPSSDEQVVCIPYGSTWDWKLREFRF